MGCYFENLLWYSDSFFYYGRISFSFIGSFIVMDESAAIFVFAFSVFLRSRGGGASAILDDYKWSLFSGICRRMKKSATVESYECWKKEMNV